MYPDIIDLSESLKHTRRKIRTLIGERKTMDKKTVKAMLENADRESLLDMIAKISQGNSRAEKMIIEWCKENNSKYKKNAIELELEKLWGEARVIISEFNEYGGGPDSEEEEACDNLYKMEEIVGENEISKKIRIGILDEMLEQAMIGNSGFDDVLMDVAEAFCKDKEDMRYFANRLAEEMDGYYRNYAADIFYDLGDDERFIEIKLSNLRYGSDYVDIARYYAEKGDKEKELEYIWQGLEKCSGRLDELIDYIAPVYRKEKNEAELERLYKLAVKTQKNYNIASIAKQLYEYSRKKGDYQSKKGMLLLILDTCENKELKKWFEVCENELHGEDWQKEYENILEKIRKKDMKFYLDICMDNGREEDVLRYLQEKKHRYDFWDVDYNQYFSKRLAVKYPDEVLELYWSDVGRFLLVTNNKNYEMAVSRLKLIKALMKQNKRQEEWEQRFSHLKEEHRRKKNFIAMLGKL